MPVFNNISDVLNFTGGDTRYMPVALPYGFNHWSEGRRQLVEDNLDFFKDRSINAAEHTVGVLAGLNGNGEETIRGWMCIFPGSRYVCTDWRKRLGKPTVVPTPDALGQGVRKANAEMAGA